MVLDAVFVAAAAAMSGCSAAALSATLIPVSGVALAESGRGLALSDSRVVAESAVRAVSEWALPVSGRVAAESAVATWLVSLGPRLLGPEREALSFDASIPGAYA